jgi:hypothetical protein
MKDRAMSGIQRLACPFVYRDGHKCGGFISHARLYGGRDFPSVRKVRLWCSEKSNHEGAVSSYVGKERMEFYPDKLPSGVWEAIETGVIPSDR